MGNPSDGYFGKTISLSISNFWADVTIVESAKLVCVNIRTNRVNIRTNKVNIRTSRVNIGTSRVNVRTSRVNIRINWS